MQYEAPGLDVFPLGHDKQVFEPALEYLPAGHFLQKLAPSEE